MQRPVAPQDDLPAAEKRFASDLFRSGATMNAITGALYDQGRARDVYALTLTRTRSKQ
jgi:hypothetical protein